MVSACLGAIRYVYRSRRGKAVVHSGHKPDLFTRRYNGLAGAVVVRAEVVSRIKWGARARRTRRSFTLTSLPTEKSFSATRSQQINCGRLNLLFMIISNGHSFECAASCRTMELIATRRLALT